LGFYRLCWINKRRTLVLYGVSIFFLFLYSLNPRHSVFRRIVNCIVLIQTVENTHKQSGRDLPFGILLSEYNSNDSDDEPYKQSPHKTCNRDNTKTTWRRWGRWLIYKQRKNNQIIIIIIIIIISYISLKTRPKCSNIGYIDQENICTSYDGLLTRVKNFDQQEIYSIYNGLLSQSNCVESKQLNKCKNTHILN